MNKNAIRAGACLLLAVCASLLLSCVSTGRLGEYRFQDRELAAVMKVPPRADVFADSPVWIDPNDIVGTVLRAGTAIVKQVEAQEVRERMKEAVARAEIPEQVRRRLLDKGADILRCEPIQDYESSDFFFELEIRRYGIDAGSPFVSVQFVLDLRVKLRDARTGAKIWATRISESEPISPSVFGMGEVVGNVVSAAILAELSEEEIVKGLQQLADEAADRVAARLQDAALAARFEF